MHALAKTEAAKGAIRPIETDPPRVAPGQVLLRSHGGGVCGTDVSIYHWYPPIAREYHPTLPLIMGHEFSGTVEEVGEGVEGVTVGQVMAVNPHVNCGACFFCNAGRHPLCENRRVMGCHIDGGWAEWVAVPRANLHALPDGVDPQVAALMEPFSVAVHAVCERVPCEPGDTVLVMGAGTIGLLHLLVARALGAGAVIVTGLTADRGRLALAEELGGIPVNVEERDLNRIVRGINPRGADVAYDTTGHAGATQPALEALRSGGRLAMVGLNHDDVTFDSLPLALDEKELVGCRAYNRNTWLKSTALLEGLAPEMKGLITHTLPFSEVEEAFALIERRECIKVVLQPDA